MNKNAYRCFHVFLLVLGFQGTTFSFEAKVQLTQEFKSNGVIKDIEHSVKESLFQGRNKYGISGAVFIELANGKKHTCRYAKEEFFIDGKVTSQFCKLDRRFSYGKHEVVGFNVLNQLTKASVTRPGEKEPYCLKHLLNSVFEIVVDGIVKSDTKLGFSETTLYSTCQDI